MKGVVQAIMEENLGAKPKGKLIRSQSLDTNEMRFVNIKVCPL